MKTILVTGGAGFIGSHLCERLAREGNKVISLDNYFTGSRDNHVAGVEYREGHTKNIEQYVPETPDIIYHLGEYSRVEISLTEPAIVWDFNSAGTFGVLEFWRKRKRKLVYAGSSTKFGDGGLGRVQTPYAWTKASNTELVQNYERWYSLPYAITYFYNVYGPRERPANEYGTLIETFRRQRLAGQPLTVVSPGTQKRNFTHVDDIIDGLVLVGERGEGDEFGLGSPEAHSVLEVAKMFGGEIIMLPERQGNRMDSTLDITKARALGWMPRNGLQKYIASA
ncbi:ADP-L-glycero-D-manno-heptose-6-epimerase [Candidatus Adlerbacteria bacterium RIFCSPHIGHO2_01_FULL_54_23]|uniref:ADP-L-glycero-D-manno-heptose-6-epimerase n=3 Tax=Candidatus Adleribacteriota TaxID=1752736 RepID=A0A1F4Y043_9BACT|nr:MAG: ADP-L-glycero-D-mannoheptose-6-epimerase [Candidatus Adlerbacteria bacterium GW2011_GWA1_54_10]KKW36357.1 MAG: ADP-L-glycero-D-mannoheptose-6-epimerase [Candidatus Adlerbacteria bacterium GW2011_GWA2_54_12]KKW37502.1 MAG: ADP-L-glycero-D-mannoheptose-6-epimerase [Candidatus Adlerbacteria bacterium GW2011_GWB1_54_7]OGC79305.1 MAG: ADP-L-glycero-D-manno-heptose-6-epimerase [Candidatus Adlerbacteria bacterium RIFCSPHIGHO2_01_FULL_54_23]OGC87337.1 MAG: ADP-L-glycero-D-manno-heptose-6-epimer